MSKTSGAEQTSEINKSQKIDDKFKNLSWLEANQLAIYKRSKRVWTPDHGTWTWGLRIASPTLFLLGHATMKKIAQFLFLEMVVMFIRADTIIGPPYISGPGCSKLG